MSLLKTNLRTLESESVSVDLLEELSGCLHPSLQDKWNSLMLLKSTVQHCDQSFIRHQTHGDESVAEKSRRKQVLNNSK
jgi:hypothetical protein